MCESRPVKGVSRMTTAIIRAVWSGRESLLLDVIWAKRRFNFCASVLYRSNPVFLYDISQPNRVIRNKAETLTMSQSVTPMAKGRQPTERSVSRVRLAPIRNKVTANPALAALTQI